MKVSPKFALIAFALLGGCSDPPEPNATKRINDPALEKPVTSDKEGSTTGSTSQSPTSDTQTNPSKPADDSQIGKRIFALSELDKATITYNGKPIKVWLMNTDSKREEGMMFLHRTDVKADEGMLFVFPSPSEQAFWMKNTLMDLDLAYIGPTGSVVSAHKLKALDETSVPSGGACQYVLEMRAGDFEPYGIKAGGTFKIPSTVTTSE